MFCNSRNTQALIVFSITMSQYMKNLKKKYSEKLFMPHLISYKYLFYIFLLKILQTHIQASV